MEKKKIRNKLIKQQKNTQLLFYLGNLLINILTYFKVIKVDIKVLAKNEKKTIHGS